MSVPFDRAQLFLGYIRGPRVKAWVQDTSQLIAEHIAFVLRYCRNVHPMWVKFNSKDTKESEWCFEVLSTKSKKRT